MPDNNFKEVSIVVIACITLFLTLGAIIVLFLFIYQRRRFQQQQELTDLQQQFKEQSLRAQVEIQEQTFLAISQEIHDNVGQLLSLAKVQINIINETKRIDDELLYGVRENIGKAMTDLRDLSRSLNSERIRHDNIHDILLQETERINRTGTIRMEVTVDGKFREIEPQKKLILFRILQESIQNCIKHAEATQMSILFNYQPEHIYVTVRDDGKGFDLPNAMEHGKGQGLINMRNRVRLAGGTSSIKTNPNEGTLITINIPYE